ncbi:protein-lysine N-methyltransferase EEF2KMT [Chrysoperla carnea]|uniref:protein-lysine N-methyltransferase EEF2KMT n=1 Tax=Chrysoperla carnea TaxID=189513 RepID=UPI001D08DF3A|nr:protein-lysine N-methyltransferase EEF2KMT [Chrysoperla carnea]
MNENDFSSYLVNIQKQFFSGVPVTEISLKDICFEITEENEAKLIDGTVNHPIILKYPVKYSYQTIFLKKLLSILESGSTSSEIADTIYEHYVRVLNSKSDVYYKHYYLNHNDIITLEENPNLISDGTTGLCTWQASLHLAEWCIQNNHLFDSKNIFELGSGVGLLGIVLSKKTTAKEIWLSDCHSQVLNKLCKNIKLNTTDYKIIDEIDLEQFDLLKSGRTLLKAVSDGVEGQKTFGVKLFDWVDVSTPGLFSDLFCDYVLAADVVYDSSVFEHLLRNAETLKSFLKTIEQTESLHYRKLDCVKPKVLFWNQDTPIELYAVYSRRRIFIDYGVPRNDTKRNYYGGHLI